MCLLRVISSLDVTECGSHMCSSVVEHFPVLCVALGLCLGIGGEKDIGGSVKR